MQETKWIWDRAKLHNLYRTQTRGFSFPTSLRFSFWCSCHFYGNARQNGVVKGVLNGSVDHGVNMFKYADGKNLLLQDDVENAK